MQQKRKLFVIPMDFPPFLFSLIIISSIPITPPFFLLSLYFEEIAKKIKEMKKERNKKYSPFLGFFFFLFRRSVQPPSGIIQQYTRTGVHGIYTCLLLYMFQKWTNLFVTVGIFQAKTCLYVSFYLCTPRIFVWPLHRHHYQRCIASTQDILFRQNVPELNVTSQFAMLCSWTFRNN